ncbi:MAG: hypothetical protein H0U03_05900 [Actinobacteria bacterium]|nr:hypothetical protein [Actinomycetota bacterium]
MNFFARLADLPVEVGAYGLGGLSRDVSSAFTRETTVVQLEGAGHEGVGEDVTYAAEDQRAFQSAGATLSLAGRHTLASFSELLETLELFPGGASDDAFRNYRRWGLESAALDLALRQAGLSLSGALRRTPAPVAFVVSMRLGEPPSAEPVRKWLELYPDLRFKLDPTSSWDENLIAELVDTGAIDSVDLKGAYRGTVVDQPPDPVLYERVASAFPDAWIEDPALTPETEPVLSAHRDRITWDAVIHSVEDIEALPFAPRMLNIKPSRFGSLRSLFDAYDHCEANGIRTYGGGQFELGPGRGQIQYLASLFHPHEPNDVAPGGYNDAEPKAGLPTSPLAAPGDEPGFRLDTGG